MVQEIMEERFFTNKRWEKGNECLNLTDINQPPENYNKSTEIWINELTTFISLYPLEWQRIKQEYDSYISKMPDSLQRLHDLKFMRTDDGYLRLTGEKDVLLRISCFQELMKPYILRMADKIVTFRLLNFDTYTAYCQLQTEERKEHVHYLRQIFTSYLVYKTGLENIQWQLKRSEPQWLKYEIDIAFEEDYDSSVFKGIDTYIDILNYSYTNL